MNVFLVPAHPGCSGQRAVVQLLFLLFTMMCSAVFLCWFVAGLHGEAGVRRVKVCCPPCSLSKLLLYCR